MCDSNITPKKLPHTSISADLSCPYGVEIIEDSISLLQSDRLFNRHTTLLYILGFESPLGIPADFRGVYPDASPRRGYPDLLGNTLGGSKFVFLEFLPTVFTNIFCLSDFLFLGRDVLHSF